MKFLLILLLLLQTNSLKANEINYLLNIPNLEIYKLNNANGLKYLSAKKTTIGTVIKDIKVDTTIMLEILSTVSFGEYISAIK